MEINLTTKQLKFDFEEWYFLGCNEIVEDTGPNVLSLVINAYSNLNKPEFATSALRKRFALLAKQLENHGRTIDPGLFSDGL